MSEANATQVGGDHYKTPYEHWDWALDIDIGFLEYAATKYLARLGKKTGEAREQALGKVLHYIVKMEENADRLLLRPRMPPRWVAQQTKKFCEVNGIRDEVEVIVRLLTLWETTSDLREARRIINQRLIGLPAKSVPLEDSNKHAPREVINDRD